MNAPSKMDLLNRYMTKPVKRFLQIDGFADAPDDDVMRGGDVDGDTFSYGTTHELMRSPGPDLPVRILIHEDSDPEDVRRLLIKAVRMLDDGFAFMAEPHSTEAPF